MTSETPSQRARKPQMWMFLAVQEGNLKTAKRANLEWAWSSGVAVSNRRQVLVGPLYGTKFTKKDRLEAAVRLEHAASLLRKPKRVIRQ